MNKIILIFFFLVFGLNSNYAQVEGNVYELNSIENPLTKDVKEIIDTNLKDKNVVFLGESNHHSGSDLLGKTEFVKYLVLEKGYKNIAFESDFFALYFEHNNNIETNLYSFWSRSIQGNALFDFLKTNNVTIWGFDNQMVSGYTRNKFAEKLDTFFNENKINVNKDFISLTDTFLHNRSQAKKIIGKSNLEMLVNEIEGLLLNKNIIQSKLWLQFLENYKSDILMSLQKSGKTAKPIRDKQMAKNLDFLVRSMPDKKFMVWLHNAHMIKDNYGTEDGITMGFQFVEKNPDISYHIAFSYINDRIRKPRSIEKYSKDEGNLLHFLPTTDKNFFIDSKQMVIENPEYKEKEYEGMFVVQNKKIKTNWLKHYDALVFISKGEYVQYAE